MGFIITIVSLVFLFDAIWWIIANRLTGSKRGRGLVALFMTAQTFGLIWLLLERFAHSGEDRWLPKFVISAIFIWHTLVLPPLLALLLAASPAVAVFYLARLFRRYRSAPSPSPVDQPSAGSELRWSRRDFLQVAVASAPPLFTIGLTTVAMRQLAHFRVRRFRLPIRDLPKDLHGLTIAQVSDMHVGRFTSGRVLNRMVDAVNQLKSDLVLLIGDLINDALADLDHGIELVRAMQPQDGLYLIEGNHDLIENGAEFERRMKASGIAFLLDQSAVLSVRGSPIQLFGLSWTRARQNRDQAIAASVRRLLAKRRPDAFPILLAHHPHAFDAAVAASIPLTLSGHTHGGQLMLNEGCGFGPAMFRYWSGLYARAESKLIVSNGVGNWYPLRINAPAEIVHLTLVRS